MQDYRKLFVWQKAHKLTLDVYADSANIWRIGRPGSCADQVTRAAISVPSNIAEGSGRGSDSDFRRFCFYSLGSVNELEYDLLLAQDLAVPACRLHDSRAAAVAEVRRMLSALPDAEAST